MERLSVEKRGPVYVVPSAVASMAVRVPRGEMTKCVSSPPPPLLLLLLLLLGSLTQALVTGAPHRSSPPAAGFSTIVSSSIADSRRRGQPQDFPSLLGVHAAGQAIYVIEFEAEASDAVQRDRALKDGSDGCEAQSPLDPWSIVWYIGSFGGLIAFFLIVSCSEWCCRRGARLPNAAYAQCGESVRAPGSESPPPPYHLFAPPAYDSVGHAEGLATEAKGSAGPPADKLAIYVISLPA